jgi:hypothetical protein
MGWLHLAVLDPNFASFDGCSAMSLAVTGRRGGPDRPRAQDADDLLVDQIRDGLGCGVDLRLLSLDLAGTGLGALDLGGRRGRGQLRGRRKFRA